MVTDTRSGGATNRLWTAFVLGWLPVLGFSVWGLTMNQLGPLRLAGALLGVIALGALYLRLTLRGDGVGRTTTRRPLLALVAMTALVGALTLLVPAGSMWWLVMHVIVAAGLTLPPALAAGMTAGLVGLALASAWLVAGRFEATLLVQISFGAAAILVRQLTLTVAELRAAREDLARLAVAEERLRFARDLHDLLGHSLSVIVLKSELAGRLLPAAPQRAAREIGDVERAGREALRQVRAAVTGYRQPSLSDELTAARELLPAAGIALVIEGQAGNPTRALDGLLAWAVREGVTNVIRHSRARRCVIRLGRDGDTVFLEITDDGHGAVEATAEGSGLAGLAERAALQGGRLTTGTAAGGGFCLRLEAPIGGAREGDRA